MAPRCVILNSMPAFCKEKRHITIRVGQQFLNNGITISYCPCYMDVDLVFCSHCKELLELVVSPLCRHQLVGVSWPQLLTAFEISQPWVTLKYKMSQPCPFLPRHALTLLLKNKGTMILLWKSTLRLLFAWYFAHINKYNCLKLSDSQKPWVHVVLAIGSKALSIRTWANTWGWETKIRSVQELGAKVCFWFFVTSNCLACSKSKMKQLKPLKMLVTFAFPFRL